MICIGYNDDDKQAVIDYYCDEYNIERVFLFSPKKFKVPCCVHSKQEVIEWADIIMYKYYYRLLQEIDKNTLLVINQCLRTQNRNDLTYNCLRNFLNQTQHQIVFQHLPIIDTIEDFMVLFDFDTRSKWKRKKFDPALLSEADVFVKNVSLDFSVDLIEVSDRFRLNYEKKKNKMIDEIGLRDPHTIPRNLYLMGGKAKLERVNDLCHYVGRNNRFKIKGLRTYREGDFCDAPYTVFEFPHNFIIFSDFVALSRQNCFPVLSADIKVDKWYVDRYQNWAERVIDACSAICDKEECS